MATASPTGCEARLLVCVWNQAANGFYVVPTELDSG